MSIEMVNGRTNHSQDKFFEGSKIVYGVRAQRPKAQQCIRCNGAEQIDWNFRRHTMRGCRCNQISKCLIAKTTMPSIAIIIIDLNICYLQWRTNKPNVFVCLMLQHLLHWWVYGPSISFTLFAFASSASCVF